MQSYYEIYKLVTGENVEEIISFSFIAFISILFGSTFVLAGGEFEKETDSNKIYAYSASIIALISCIVSIIAMLGI